MAASVSNDTLLPPNATKFERDVERAIAFVIFKYAVVPIRDLWNPNTCPAPLLPWLAWAFSVDSWKDYWPEHVKRARIRNAIEIQRQTGTAKSVRDVVEAFGGSIVMREWWELDPPGEPHTFDIVLTLSGQAGEPASAQFVDDVINEVSRTKPVRSHFTFTQGVNVSGGVGIVAAARAAVYRRLQFDGA